MDLPQMSVLAYILNFKLLQGSGGQPKCTIARNARSWMGRSEAVPINRRVAWMDDGYRFAPPILRTCTSRSRGVFRPRFASSLPPSKQRAQGRPGARCTRGLVCNCANKSAHEHTGSAGTLRPSLRSGFTAYFVLSPVNGSFATVAPEKLASQELDASTAASGPHDFAVRITRARLAHASRPPHLTARS